MFVQCLTCNMNTNILKWRRFLFFCIRWKIPFQLYWSISISEIFLRSHLFMKIITDIRNCIKHTDMHNILTYLYLFSFFVFKSSVHVWLIVFNDSRSLFFLRSFFFSDKTCFDLNYWTAVNSSVTMSEMIFTKGWQLAKEHSTCINEA